MAEASTNLTGASEPQTCAMRRTDPFSEKRPFDSIYGGSPAAG